MNKMVFNVQTSKENVFVSICEHCMLIIVYFFIFAIKWIERLMIHMSDSFKISWKKAKENETCSIVSSLSIFKRLDNRSYILCRIQHYLLEYFYDIQYWIEL